MSDDVCQDCYAPLPYAMITKLCDACLDLTCPACTSGSQKLFARWSNGCPRYRCDDCGTEWSNTEDVDLPV